MNKIERNMRMVPVMETSIASASASGDDGSGTASGSGSVSMSDGSRSDSLVQATNQLLQARQPVEEERSHHPGPPSEPTDQLIFFASNWKEDLYVFALNVFAFTGCVLFWIGSWNLISYFIVANPGIWYPILCAMLGLLALLATDTLSYQTGIGGTGMGPVSGSILSWLRIDRSRKSRLRLRFETLIALVGSVLLWKGLWDIFDVWVFSSSMARAMTYVLLGLAGMFLTDTLDSNSGVDTTSGELIGAPLSKIDSGSTSCPPQQHLTFSSVPSSPKPIREPNAKTTSNSKSNSNFHGSHQDVADSALRLNEEDCRPGALERDEPHGNRWLG